MKKKVNIFGKTVPVFVLVLLGVGLVGAALVPFLSNTVFGTTEVSSPLEIIIKDVSPGTFNANSYSVAISGGETYTVDTDLIIHTDVTGHIAESVIFDFDGVGINVNVNFFGDIGDFDITGCTADDPAISEQVNTYYYIGDPNDLLPGGNTISSTTTVTTALNLEPRTYESETKVILAEFVKCGPLFSS